MSEDFAAPLPFVARDTEQLVLGACLIREGSAAVFMNDGIREHHFYSGHHRTIWRRIQEALHEGIVPDFPVVRMLLAKHGELEGVGIGYLASLSDGVVRLNVENVQAIARRLIECSVGRDTLRLLQKAQAHLVEQPDALSDGFFSRLDASMRSLSAQLAGRRLPDHISHISDVMQEVLASLKGGAPDFIDTPWPALTSMLGGGFAPGELAYLGGRPGCGKTAGALEIVRRAGKRGRSSFIVSREMLKVKIGIRMVAQEGPVHATLLRKRKLEPAHWRTIELAVEQLEGLPVFLTHTNIDIDEIRRIVGVLCEEGKLDLLVVDYLQLINAPAGIRERRMQVEAVSAGLKAITLDYGISVLCLSSLSRGDGSAPTLASLRESGNLEHDADTVIFLHRPEELQATTQCIVAKARDGYPGMVELFFRGEHLKFEEQFLGGV